MIYIQLFLSFFKIGMFSIGGGYAAMPLIQNEVVTIHSWLTMKEFADIITISQMTPGPIAINSATFVGIQIAGFPGAVIATLGCVTPSFIIVLSIAMVYFKYRKLTVINGILDGLRPAVVSLIASAGVSMVLLAFFGESEIEIGKIHLNYFSVFLFAVGMFFLRKFRLSPTYVMIGSGIVGGIVYSFMGGM